MGNRFPATLLNQPLEIQSNLDMPALKRYDGFTVIGYYEGSKQVEYVSGFFGFPYVMQALMMNAPVSNFRIEAPAPQIRSRITHAVSPPVYNAQTAGRAAAPTRGIYTGVRDPF
jgi:hypothetical protein